MEALVLKIDGGVDQDLEEVRVSLAKDVGHVETVGEVIVSSFALVLAQAVKPGRLRRWEELVSGGLG